MELQILKERETPLLSRKRVTLEAGYEGATPSRLKFKDAIAKKLNVKGDMVIIKHIYTRYGLQKAKIIAHIYSNQKDLKRFEQEGLVKKHTKPEAPKEEGAGAKAEAAAE